MGKALRSNAAADAAYAEINLGANKSEIWLTCRLAFNTAALTFFTAGGSPDFFSLWQTGAVFATNTGFVDGVWIDGPLKWAHEAGGDHGTVPAPVANIWQDCEFHFKSGDVGEFYIGGSLVLTDAAAATTIRHVMCGFDFSWAGSDPDSIAYIDEVKIGTTRGASDLFADDFEGGDLSAWTSTFGAVSVVDDPFADNLLSPEGVCIGFTANALDSVVAWTRLDA